MKGGRVYVRELVATYRIKEGWVTRHTLRAGTPQTAASMFAQILGEEASVDS